MIVVLALLVRLQGIALDRERLVYLHPRVENRFRVVRVEGPVRIVTRTIRTEGREETVREEVRGPVVSTTDAVHIETPAFAPPRPPRWVAGASLLDFRPSDRSGWTAWGGVSAGGRLDICLGLTGDLRPGAMILFHF
ncbi:MAG: hypothetical protein E6Q97_32295 [Desulfurellales bacterium]|nr:MAG: hypothetical protein E6Q97_32295 [Desulfurellales bacterium]